ncbi:sodium:solute symporter [Litorivivens sp.]|uniref:sodium:solute symporter n=1 Tax=Litorivivens sp. TaxID=2020868 RepID=UPI003567DE2F
MSLADGLVLGGYLLGILLLGVYFSGRTHSTDDYFVGGRNYQGWVIGLSLVGTSISSVTFLAYPADAYKTAWLRYLPNLMLPLAIYFAARYFLPVFRRGNTVTAYEFLEERFGPSVRVYGAATFIIAQLVRVSTILYLISLLLFEISGLDPVWCIVLAGIFVAVYTVAGGIEAVIWTDVIQTLVLLLGGIACLWVIVDLLPGGLGQVLSTATEHGKLGFSEWQNGELEPVSWDISLLNKTGTMMLVLGLVNWLTEYSSNQNTVQRYCAAKSESEARRGMWVCALSSLPIWAFYMFLGTALYVFYLQFPVAEAAEMLDGSRKAEQILPFFILNELPPGLIGLVLAAALAAAMSSLDSSINAISAVSVVDIYRRHMNTDAAERHYLMVARAIAVGVSCLMIGGAIAFYFADTKTLQDALTILVALLGGGMLSLYLFGFFSRRGNARHAWLGIGVTMLFTGWVILARNGWFFSADDMPFDLYYTAIIGNLLMFVVLWLASRRTPLRTQS